jgi:hypothetical protein
MLRKGYIERLVEGLVLVLTRVLDLKEKQDYAGALSLLRTAGKNLSGMDIDTLPALSDKTLLTLFAANNVLDVARSVVVARLLGEQADIYEAQGRTDAAAVSRRKALVLFTELLMQEEDLRTNEYRARVDALIAGMRERELPPALHHRLFRYHEAVGEYARAEDALFALRESNYPDASAEAVSFYRRLLTKSDEALTAGGLPREEVEETLAEVAP